jgi:hypothetical protein
MGCIALKRNVLPRGALNEHKVRPSCSFVGGFNDVILGLLSQSPLLSVQPPRVLLYQRLLWSKAKRAGVAVLHACQPRGFSTLDRVHINLEIGSLQNRNRCMYQHWCHFDDAGSREQKPRLVPEECSLGSRVCLHKEYLIRQIQMAHHDSFMRCVYFACLLTITIPIFVIFSNIADVHNTNTSFPKVVLAVS